MTEMSDDEVDTEIDIEKKDAGGEVTPPVVDDSMESGIEALRQQIVAAEETRKQIEKERDEARRLGEGERQAREEAERRAQHFSADAQTKARTASDAQYDSVVNGLAAAQGELTAAKGMLKTAMSEGDFDKVAELSGEIGLVAARVREFEGGKAMLEDRRKNGEPASQQQGDPKEAYIQKMPPRTAAWLRRNDRFFTDMKFQQMVQGAHNLAVGRGVPAESDDYFRFVEEQVGLRQPEPLAAVTPPAVIVPPAATAATTTAPRQSSIPAAPPAGSTASVTRPSAGGNTIKLSPEEREVCRVNGITEAAYAKQKIALMAEGRLGTGH